MKQVVYRNDDALTMRLRYMFPTLNGPFTDPLALQAIEMVLDYLPASYRCDMMCESRCIMRSVWQEWHFPMRCLVSLLYGSRLEPFSTGHSTDAQMQSTFPCYSVYQCKDPVAAKRYAEIARRMGLPGTSESAYQWLDCKDRCI